jgi:hypothetical protein
LFAEQQDYSLLKSTGNYRKRLYYTSPTNPAGADKPLVRDGTWLGVSGTINRYNKTSKEKYEQIPGKAAIR